MAWTRSDAFLELRVRRTLAAGILVSILIHLAALLILLMVFRQTMEVQAGRAEQGPPITARLAPLPAPVPPKSPAPPEPVEKPVEKPKPAPRSRPIMTIQRPSDRSVPASRPVPAPPVQSDTAPPVDMLAMLNASRERRRQQDAEAAQENAAAEAAQAEPSADQIAQANIARNLEHMRHAGKGESGVFQIRSIGIRTGTFSFRGWTDDPSNSHLQVIDVEAKSGETVQLAIVRSMISLIREHYQGDFNFDSHRLGRIVVQSARLEDTPKLEAFLMQEFFGG